ncbi:hypothetical protein [Saccharothrix sp. HUAS TT1]|uniref:hypothetical protein n=1 Tax=unclassified Saccharothrix TaxID=2593673 RepID=UPI00345BB060
MFAVAAAAVTMITTATPVVAAPSVDLRCQSYGSHFTCFAVRSGTAPAALTWTRNGVPVPTSDGRGYFLGQCVLGEVVDIAVTATDSTGSTTAGKTFPCNTGPWPENAGTLR